MEVYLEPDFGHSFGIIAIVEQIYRMTAEMLVESCSSPGELKATERLPPLHGW
jgi:hypothetical protein